MSDQTSGNEPGSTDPEELSDQGAGAGMTDADNSFEPEESGGDADAGDERTGGDEDPNEGLDPTARI